MVEKNDQLGLDKVEDVASVEVKNPQRLLNTRDNGEHDSSMMRKDPGNSFEDSEFELEINDPDVMVGGDTRTFQASEDFTGDAVGGLSPERKRSRNVDEILKVLGEERGLWQLIDNCVNPEELKNCLADERVTDRFVEKKVAEAILSLDTSGSSYIDFKKQLVATEGVLPDHDRKVIESLLKKGEEERKSVFEEEEPGQVRLGRRVSVLPRMFLKLETERNWMPKRNLVLKSFVDGTPCHQYRINVGYGENRDQMVAIMLRYQDNTENEDMLGKVPKEMELQGRQGDLVGKRLVVGENGLMFGEGEDLVQVDESNIGQAQSLWEKWDKSIGFMKVAESVNDLQQIADELGIAVDLQQIRSQIISGKMEDFTGLSNEDGLRDRLLQLWLFGSEEDRLAENEIVGLCARMSASLKEQGIDDLGGAVLEGVGTKDIQKLSENMDRWVRFMGSVGVGFGPRQNSSEVISRWEMMFKVLPTRIQRLTENDSAKSTSDGEDLAVKIGQDVSRFVPSAISQYDLRGKIIEAVVAAFDENRRESIRQRIVNGAGHVERINS